MTGPEDGEVASVTYDGKNYMIVKEGLADILVPAEEAGTTGEAHQIKSVFYNPIQQYNRDLSVLAIRVFAEDFLTRQKQKLEPRESEDTSVRTEKRKRTEDEAEDTLLPPKKLKTPEGAIENAASISVTSKGAEPPNNKAEETTTNDVDTHPRPLNPPVMPLQNQPSTDTLVDSADLAVPRAPKALSKLPFKILDALSATGLRALRYSKEIEQVTLVTANDLSPMAVASIKLNVKHNQLHGVVHPIAGDALAHMCYVARQDATLPDGSRGKYHVADLDPYGTSGPFLDAAVRSVQDDGLLCVTCTDSAVLASCGHIEKTFAQYGGLPIKGPHSHEGGIRLVLHAIATSAARYKLAIEPLLSLSIDFYIRVFVRVRKSPLEVKLLLGKTIEVLGCDQGCGAWSIQPLGRTQTLNNKNGETLYKYCSSQAPVANTHCSHCGFRTHLVGPMWGGPLHNPYFVQRMIDLLPSLDENTYGTIPRMKGMLCTARDELLLPEKVMGNGSLESSTASGTGSSAAPIQRLPASLRDPHPFFIELPQLAKVLHCSAPSAAAFRSALIKLNYRVTRSHAKPGSIRTDAPWTVIWEVMREWCRQKCPDKPVTFKKGTAGYGIMRHDRRKGELIEMRDELHKAIDEVDDTKALESTLQAMLWRCERLRKAEAPPNSESNAEDSARVAEEQQHEGVNGDGHVHKLEIVFDEALGKEPRERKLRRYQQNPRPDWGPIRRARA